MTEQWLLWAGAGMFLLFIILSFFKFRKLPTYLAFAGCVCIMATLLLRWYDLGRAPWATLYETSALLALVTGTAASYVYRRKASSAMYLALAAVTVALLAFSAASWEANAQISPALESGWLLIHVPIVIVAYGMFAVSFAASAGYILLKILGRGDARTFKQLDKASYIGAAIGLALLAVGIILGALWAKAAWGSYWSWDPKELWALITAIVYAIYLAARKLGMKAEDAAFISILGFLAVIFTYFGVSYLIPGLHSYY